jgi:tetratricopeptide (TPR) repeat protein
MQAEAVGRAAEAIAHYLQASDIDDHFADLHFRLARCYWGTGQFETARTRYVLARDWDALEFRADSRINDAIHQTAIRGQNEGRLWIDADQALSESELSDHRIPGEKLFYEYVHFRWDGDYQMARTLYPVVVRALEGDNGSAAPVATIPSKEICERALAYNVINEAQMINGMLQLTGKPPFLDRLEHAQRQAATTREYERRAAALTQSDLRQALEIHRAAIAQNPQDWWLHYNYGMLYQTGQDYTRSAAQLEKAVSLMPHLASLRVAWAGALARTGQRDAALRQIQEALRIDPQYPPARQALTGDAPGTANTR